MPKAHGSQLIAQCVRDWSGILCERFGNEVRDLGIGDGNGARSLSLSKCQAHILSERGKQKASKDIAESPTAIAGTPRDELSAISGQQSVSLSLSLS